MSPERFREILKKKQTQSKYNSSRSGGYASRKEHRRALFLKDLEQRGVIKNLREQVKYELIPSQYEDSGEVYKGKPKRKLIERSCSYLADFVYEYDGKTIVEDTKGFRTETYIVKRKLMLYRYGIRIKEI